MFYVIAAKCETNTTWDSTLQYKGRNLDVLNNLDESQGNYAVEKK